MAKTVHRFPKMMYHENGIDTCAVKDSEEKDNLGEEWVDNPVHQFHGCQPPDVPPKGKIDRSLNQRGPAPPIVVEEPAQVGEPASDEAGGGETEEEPSEVEPTPIGGQWPPSGVLAEAVVEAKAPTKKEPKKKGK